MIRPAASSMLMSTVLGNFQSKQYKRLASASSTIVTVGYNSLVAEHKYMQNRRKEEFVEELYYWSQNTL